MISFPRQHPFRLRRIAHSPFARLLARVLALLMIFSNLAAAAMPERGAAMNQAHVHAMTSGIAHHHCDGGNVSAPSAGQKSIHRGGCPCCMGGACACLHLLATMPVLATVGSIQPQPMYSSRLRDFAVADVTLAERLRPPIV